MNILKRKSAKLATICLILALVAATIMAIVFTHNGAVAHAATQNGQAFCSITSEFVAEDYRIYDSTSIDEVFADDTILLVMTRRESRAFREYTIADFPEVRLASVECITPGLNIARNQLRAQVSSRVSHHYYDSTWSINIDTFRRILILRLAEPSKQNVLDAVRLLGRRADVHNAAPDVVVPREVEFNREHDCFCDDDHCADFLTGCSSPADTTLWNLARINVGQAHGITTGSQNVRVGLLSTGIEVSHSNLTGRVYERLSQNFLAAGNALEDTDGHGTHIAGTIVGSTTGVAPNIRLVSLRVADTRGYFPAAITTAIRDIIDAGEENINDRIHILSLSSSPHRNNVAVRNAIDDFSGLFVGSAGNDNRNAANAYPMLVNNPLDNHIVIGASRRSRPTVFHSWRDERANFSNFSNTAVCIFAPGHNIRSTVPTHVHSSGFRNWQGTSMAVPHVVGTAALMLSVNPELTGAELKELIFDTVNTGSSVQNSIRNNSISQGLLNTYAAVRAAGNARIFNTRIVAGGIEITGVRRQLSGHVEIPGYIGIHNVVSIGPSAFANQTQLAQITMIQRANYKTQSAYCTAPKLIAPSAKRHRGNKP